MRDSPAPLDPAFGIPPPGFRLPASTRCGRVRLRVSNLSRSIEFYTGVLGLQAASLGATSTLLSADTASHPLIELHEEPGTSPARRGACGLYHFAIRLPDRAVLGRFLSHSVDRSVRVGSADHLVSEALYFSDPDGLGIEVYADRPRATWRTRATELVMVVDPLDVSGVVDAAGGRRWDGAPGGTTMGHLHLHVGDLAAAERFYFAGLGFDKTAWSYPGALFFAAGGYHHHLGTNTWGRGPAARDDEARLLEWELLLPAGAAEAAARSLRESGFDATPDAGAWITADPWGTRLRLVPSDGPAGPDTATAQPPH